MWYFYGQRRREEFKKAVEGVLKFFPGIKRTPEQELCFQSRVVKRKDVLGVWKSLIYQLLPKLCRNIGFTRPWERRQYQCLRYLTSDLQYPAVKRVKLLLQIKLERGSHVLIWEWPTAPRLLLDFACACYDSVRDWNSFASSSKIVLTFEMS